MGQRLEANATLAAFEEADLFAKVSGYLSDVRVDICDHMKAGQVLAVIDIPEMEQELAEDKAQLASKQSALETARREADHQSANVTLQDVTLKRQEALFNEHWIFAQTLDEMRAKAAIAKADLGVAEANSALAANQIDLAAATVERIKTLIAYSQIVAPFDGVVARRLVNPGRFGPGPHGHADDTAFHSTADRHDPGVLLRSRKRRSSPSHRRSGHRRAVWL